jgi:hypothetical protein
MSSKELTPNIDLVMRQNVMKEEFGWEVPVESIPLPSRGIIYHPDSSLYNREILKIKAMTAREEDILASPAFHKEGTSLTHLIQSCLMEKGINSEDMIEGDRNALMIGIRVTGYGPEYHASSACQSCNNKNDFIVDLSKLPIKRLEISPVKNGENRFEFILPVTKKKIIFKYLTAKDERERKATSNSMQRVLGAQISNNITSFLENSIVSIDNVTDRSKIKHFVINMPAYDSRMLRKYILDNEPGMDLRCNFQCKNCGHINEIQMPMTTEFFWPTK